MGVIDGVDVFSGVGVSVGRGDDVADGVREGVKVELGLGDGVAVEVLVAVGGTIVGVGVGGDDAKLQPKVKLIKMIKDTIAVDDIFI